MYKDMPGFIRIYENRRIYKDLQGFTWICKDVQGFVRTCKDLLGFRRNNDF